MRYFVFSFLWRIRQIDLYKKVLLYASIHRSFLINLLGSEHSEQLQIIVIDKIKHKR